MACNRSIGRTLATVCAAGALAFTATAATAQTQQPMPDLIVHEIMWVPVKTARGVKENVSTTAAEVSRRYDFAMLDVDDDGAIDQGEWRTTATGNGATASEAEAQFARIDDNGDGRIDRDEFGAITGADFAVAGTQAEGQMPLVVYVPAVVSRAYAG